MNKFNTKQEGKHATGDKPGLSEDEIEEIKQAFDLFDTQQKGVIDPKELISAMQSLGFDQKNPTIFEMIRNLETYETEKSGGVSFDAFLDAIVNQLGDKESKEGLERIFKLFIDDPNHDTLTINSIKKIARELGEDMNNDELTDMLQRASNNGYELTFEEFYDIMKKKSYP